MKKGLIGGIAALASTAIAGLAISYSVYLKEKSTLQAKKVKKAKSKTAKNGTKKVKKKRVPPADLPDDKTLNATILHSIQDMLETSQTEGDREQKLLRWIRNLRPSDQSVDTRIHATQWIVLYHNSRSMAASSLGEEQLHTSQREQLPDMKWAWKLLCVDPKDCDDKQIDALDMLRLDIAQRLKDKDKLLPVFERMTATKGRSLSDEELLLLFSIAPLLGKWRLTKELGDELKSIKGDLESFHREALCRLDVPDYSMLHLLAADEKEDYSAECLTWTNYTVERTRIRLKDVLCEDQTTRDLVLKGLGSVAGQPEPWKVTGSHSKRLLRRQGGFAQVQSHSTFPIMMVGPCDGRRIRVCGYGDLPIGNVRQTESYALTLDTTNTKKEEVPGRSRWVGTYTLVQEPLNRPKVEVIWDIQIRLQEAVGNVSIVAPSAGSSSSATVVASSAAT